MNKKITPNNLGILNFDFFELVGMTQIDQTEKQKVLDHISRLIAVELLNNSTDVENIPEEILMTTAHVKKKLVLFFYQEKLQRLLELVHQNPNEDVVHKQILLWENLISYAKEDQWQEVIKMMREYRKTEG